ncbi:hypothetical protein G9A89_000547, partial [Geosiphon pyriformis]
DIRVRKYEEQGIVAYFRGPTLLKKQWLERPIDLTTVPWATHLGGEVKVDSVWFRQVKTMMPFLIYKLRKIVTDKYLNKTFKIHFVGNGIGGAYALLAALHLQKSIREARKHNIHNLKLWKYKIVTFGAPRIGNYYFAEFVKRELHATNIYRMTNGNDWVSREMMPKEYFLHNHEEYWQEKVYECDCTHRVTYALNKCVGKRKNGEIDEVRKCNLGTISSETETNDDSNMGPFMGITFGNCKNINARLLQEE